MHLRAAILQMTSTNRHSGNIATLRAAAAQAKAEGAELLALPEVAGLMNRDRASADAQIVTATQDPFIAAAQEEAARHGLWIHTGSTPVRPEPAEGDDGRYLNHTSLVSSSGDIVAAYDKIHLFDVAIEGQRPIGESRRFAPGTRAVVADTPWGRWGLTICYDLRFPQLYRALAQAGAGLIFAPSAFTVPTGQAHWQVLLRARAIETFAFLLAPAQTGTHDDGRETYGHGMVVSPWGRVLADQGTAPGMAVVTLDLEEVAKARAQIPSLSHDRPFSEP